MAESIISTFQPSSLSINHIFESVIQLTDNTGYSTMKSPALMDFPVSLCYYMLWIEFEWVNLIENFEIITLGIGTQDNSWGYFCYLLKGAYNFRFDAINNNRAKAIVTMFPVISTPDSNFSSPVINYMCGDASVGIPLNISNPVYVFCEVNSLPQNRPHIHLNIYGLGKIDAE